MVVREGEHQKRSVYIYISGIDYTAVNSNPYQAGTTELMTPQSRLDYLEQQVQALNSKAVVVTRCGQSSDSFDIVVR